MRGAIIKHSTEPLPFAMFPLHFWWQGLAQFSPALRELFRRAGSGGVSKNRAGPLFKRDIPVHFLEEHNHFFYLDGDQECLIFYLPRYDCKELVSIGHKNNISELNADRFSGSVWTICWAVKGTISWNPRINMSGLVTINIYSHTTANERTRSYLE